MSRAAPKALIAAEIRKGGTDGLVKLERLCTTLENAYGIKRNLALFLHVTQTEEFSDVGTELFSVRQYLVQHWDKICEDVAQRAEDTKVDVGTIWWRLRFHSCRFIIDDAAMLEAMHREMDQWEQLQFEIPSLREDILTPVTFAEGFKLYMDLERHKAHKTLYGDLLEHYDYGGKQLGVIEHVRRPRYFESARQYDNDIDDGYGAYKSQRAQGSILFAFYISVYVLHPSLILSVTS
eukprot:84014_1